MNTSRKCLAAYAVVLIVLIWWPTGLFGKALE